jgi:hypothetical protein
LIKYIIGEKIMEFWDLRRNRPKANAGISNIYLETGSIAVELQTGFKLLLDENELKEILAKVKILGLKI